MHEEDVLGKAYDARLMRRLLTYLRPYQANVAIALAAIVSFSALELAPPYLVKLVIDRYIPARDYTGVGLVAALYLAAQIGSFVLEYVQTWTLQMTGQRICSTSGCSSTRTCSGSISGSTTGTRSGG